MKHPFSREAFTDWVGKQPKDRIYNFMSCECAIYQYLERGLGMTDPGDKAMAYYTVVTCDEALETACIPEFRTRPGERVQSFGRLHERLLAL